MRLLFVLVFAFGVSVAALAGEAEPSAENPVIEARMLALAAELRCVVCQNESLAGSQAPLANDLRQEIREMMESGMSDHQIVDFLVQRYGEFVLYKPPLKPLTYLLWFGPALLLILGVMMAIITLRKRRTAVAEISDQDHSRAQQLLADGEQQQ